MSGSTDVVVGRQGIYSTDGLAGYALLFRSLGVLNNTRVTVDQMTAAVIFGAVSIGLNNLVGDRLIFCNGDRGLITGEIPLLLPAHRTVVEVADTVEVDDEVVRGCKRLVADGYAIALDNFVSSTGHEKLLPLASIVKVDVMMASEEKLSALVEHCRAYDVRMLAEHVGHADDLPHLASLGFEMFQGFSLDRPKVVSGRTLDPQSTSGIAAAVALLDNEADFDKVEQLLKRDPALAYQIMRLASIGRLGESRRYINSIQSALVMAGTRRISNWLALLLARPSKPGTRGHDAFLSTLLRARACELLADELEPFDVSLAFAAGMLSALDYQLELPLDEIVASLPLSKELHDAVMGGNGPVATIVGDVTAYQLGTDPAEAWSVQRREQIDAAFAEAFTWAVQSAATIDSP